VAHAEQWDWYGQQRQVKVGLEFVVPDMFDLRQLQCAGQAVHWLRAVEAICSITDQCAREEAYRMHVWDPVLPQVCRCVCGQGGVGCDCCGHP
jgi:hypothetical protein